MAVTIGGAVKSSAGVTPRNVSVPSGIQDGDHWLIVIVSDGSSGFSAPSGWSTVFNGQISTEDNCSLAAFYQHFPTAPTGTVQVGGGASQEWTAASFWVRGASTTSFISGAAGALAETLNTTSPVCTAPGSGGASGDLTVAACGTRTPQSFEGVMTAPTGMTKIADYRWNAGNGDTHLAVAQESHVDNTSHTFTNGSTSSDWAGTTFVINDSGNNPTITGDITVPITVAATMAFEDNSMSIVGDITVPITVAATMLYTGPARVTRFGREVFTQSSGADLRVTRFGREILTVVYLPDPPSITQVTDITGYDALADTSAFSSSRPGVSHLFTRWQVQLAGGDWSSPVYDSGLSSDLTQHRVSGLSPFTYYEVRAAHIDDQAINRQSEWSAGFPFLTNDDTASSVPFDPDEWATLWCVTPSGQTGQPGAWAHTDSPSQPYWGDCWLQVYRYMQPTIKAFAGADGAYGMQVSGQVLWVPCQCGRWWGRYYDSELANHGVAACASGTFNVPIENTTDLFTPYYTPDDPDFHGVVAYISPGIYQAYGDCPDVGSTDQYNLIVEVWYAGAMQTRQSVDLEPKLGRHYLFKGQCHPPEGTDPIPFYHVRLDVERDRDTDPTGKTHLIKAEVIRDARPSMDVPDIEFTWVGGNEESVPGAKDGGLPCGFGGWYGLRYDQGAFGDGGSGGSGFAAFRQFAYVPTQAGSCVLTPETGVTPIETPNQEDVAGPTPQPCPDTEPTTELELYMGRSGGGEVFRFGASDRDWIQQVYAEMVTNHLSPEGFGGEFLFTTFYLAATHAGDAVVTVTPILNGEELVDEATTVLLTGTGVETTHEYKISLSRPYKDAGGVERLRHGLRGQYIAARIEFWDICSGTQLDGMEVEYEAVRESQPGVMIYTERPYLEPVWTSVVNSFWGGSDGKVRRFGVTHQDDGTDVQTVAKSNVLAPEGVGGEVIFTNLYLMVSRSNVTELEVNVTPYVDGVALGTQTLIYQPTTGAGEMVLEVEELPLTVYYQKGNLVERFRTHPRGTWIQVEVQTDSLADGWVVIDGVEVEYETVRESRASVG